MGKKKTVSTTGQGIDEEHPGSAVSETKLRANDQGTFPAVPPPGPPLGPGQVGANPYGPGVAVGLGNGTVVSVSGSPTSISIGFGFSIGGSDGPPGRNTIHHYPLSVTAKGKRGLVASSSKAKNAMGNLVISINHDTGTVTISHESTKPKSKPATKRK
jgi:hypothetical protein